MENTAQKAIEAYQNEARFRAIATACVAHAMNERGRVDPERADEDAYDIAILATATLLQRIYEDDAELRALRAHNEHLKKLVEKLNLTAFPSMLVSAEFPKPHESSAPVQP